MKKTNLAFILTFLIIGTIITTAMFILAQKQQQKNSIVEQRLEWYISDLNAIVDYVQRNQQASDWMQVRQAIEELSDRLNKLEVNQ